jgi:hypothetical protein
LELFFRTKKDEYDDDTVTRMKKMNRQFQLLKDIQASKLCVKYFVARDEFFNETISNGVIAYFSLF